MAAPAPDRLEAWLAMVERLSRSPEWAEEGPVPVEVVQTHISAVLLGGRRVLKLKKPVDYGFLDYTTLDKRRRACEAEVSLNRRLCEATYLGVQPIVMVDGEPRLDGEGPVVEYGVLMKRLPGDRMLDDMVRRGAVTEEIIDRIAQRLSRFHDGARRGKDVNAWGDLEDIKRNWEENFSQTRSYVGRSIEPAAHQLIQSWVNGWIKENRGLIEQRVKEGRIVDGHGDLRCESVCVLNGICFFDCIEFNDRFRCCDVASEVAFLAMDLDLRGRPDLAYYFAERYNSGAKDADLYRLLPFYRCYRAYVRGKVLSFRLDQAGVSAEEKKRSAGRAAAYFELARRYASPMPRPALAAVKGLSGTGKTSAARAIANELGLRVVSADQVRLDLFGAEKRPAAYGEGAYTPEATRETYQTMMARARQLLDADGGAVLDGTFLGEDLEGWAADAAAAAGVPIRWIECRLPDDVVKDRLEQRRTKGDGLSDATWEIYVQQRARHKPAVERREENCIVLDTQMPLERCSRIASDWLRKSLAI